MIPVLVFGLPVMAAWVWLRRVPCLRSYERTGAAVLFGVAVPSIVYITWRFSGGSVDAYRTADPVLWLIVLTAGTLAVPRRSGARAAAAFGRGTIGLAIVAGLLCVIYLPVVREHLRATPHGAWDAWAIWNLRARFLAGPGDAWRAAFDDALAWSHTDYPLLLPATVARAGCSIRPRPP